MPHHASAGTVMEVASTNYSVETQQLPEDQIERMVGALCERTEALAGEHAVLLAQQRQQAQIQHQALSAVQANEHNVAQLAEQQ